MMHKIRLNAFVNSSGFQDCRDQSKGIHVATAPMNRMQEETLLLDRVGTFADARRNVHLVPGFLRRARHRNPM